MRLRWSAKAEEDRTRIFAYFAERNPTAALRLDERFDEAAELLVPHPLIGREGRVAGTRELVIGGTPYLAAYRIDEDAVLVLRLLHGAQLWPEAFGDR